MLQRIQTVYLILVAVLMTLAAVLPVAEYFDVAKNIVYQLDMRGFVQLNPDGTFLSAISTNPVTFIFGIILVVTIMTIFKYKNRKQQFRLCTVNFLLILIYTIVLAVVIFVGKNKLVGTELTLKIPAVFSIVALILNYLAMRGIAKDENLVKSMDRLR
jgi:predicted ferric reductase